MKSRQETVQTTQSGPSPTEAPGPTWSDMDRSLATIEWDWPNWIPRGFLTMLVGFEEVGKSILALYLAGCYTQGWDWPDGKPYTRNPFGMISWAEGEGGERLNIDRAKAWGMDLDRMINPLSGLAPGPFDVGRADHRAAFRYWMTFPYVRAGIVDSLSGIHGRTENTAEMQRVIKPFAELARDVNKPIIITHHLRKPLRGRRGTGADLHAVRGSSVITQTARSVLYLDRPDAAKPGIRRLQLLKKSIGGLKPQALGFTIGDLGIKFGTAPLVTPGGIRRIQPTKISRAKAIFLELGMAKGWVERDLVLQTTAAADISRTQTYRAGKQVGLASITKDGKVHWRQEEVGTG